MLLNKKVVFLLLLTDFSVSGVWTAAAQATEASVAAVAGVATKVDGAKIYLDNCSICHGDRGDADTRVRDSLRPPPRNFTTESAASELSRERMINSVTNGRPGTAMMPHKDRLSSQEIVAVVDYIRSHFMNLSSDPKSIQSAAQAEGGRIYSKHCAVCHGDRGSTAYWARSGLNPPPRDFTTAVARQDLTRERMILSVTYGRPGTAMMPHKDKLTGKQIAQVVDYIRASFMTGPIVAQAPETEPALSGNIHPGMLSGGPSVPRQHMKIPGFGLPGGGSAGQLSAGKLTAEQLNAMPGHPHTANPHQGLPMANLPGLPGNAGTSASVDMSVPMPKGLKGNVNQGRTFYMNNCFTCHGVKGDGNGPRAYFNIPRPRDFTSDESRRVLNRERLFHSISNGRVGTVMPAWGKVLNDQQIANVAEFVFRTFVQVKTSAVTALPNPSGSVNKKKLH